MRDCARNYGFQSNKELMLYLKDSGYIRSNFIFDIMCSVDRKNFTTNSCTAYRDRPEPVAYEKTISAPHMHAEVLEQMSESLRQGKSALDIGSGSGYVTICMALALGEKGKVIGVDCIPGLQIMSNQIAQNHYPDLLQNNRVEYIVYDGRRGWPWGGPYDAIHVGVAAESIPETLIEQLAPGGCLVMPVGLRGNQVLVSLKKDLNGDVRKKKLMKVSYGTFTEVDLPWSSMVGSNLLMNREMKNNDILTSESQVDNGPINELFINQLSVEKIIEMTKTNREAENETLGNIDKNINKNGVSPIFGRITCSLPKNIENNKNEIKLVFNPKTNLIGDSEKVTNSMYTKADSDENLKTIQPNKDANDSNDLYNKTLTENMTIYKSVLELDCASPKTIEDDEKAQTEDTKNSDSTENSIDELKRNTCDIEASKSQDIESFSDDSDEASSVDTQIDTQAFYEDCKNCDEMSDSIQSNPKVYIKSKSFSKSLENFSTINEPVSKLRSLSTIIGIHKCKTQNVREKIDLFEKNIQNGKILNSQENVTIKLKSVPKENDNAVVKDTNKNIQVLENSKNTEILTGSMNLHTNQEIHNDRNSFSKSVENLTRIVESATSSQPIVQENLERNKKCDERVVKKEQNQISGENVEKMKEHEESRDSISSEFKLFKNEIKIILNDFLSGEKENHEEIKLRQVNLHINRINQVQLVNNLDKKVENNSQNSDQNEKSYENCDNDVANMKLSAENQDENSNDLQIQLRNIIEKVEQLQTQYDNNIGKLMSTNEELQGSITHYEGLENRLQKLEKKFKIVTKVLAKLIDKINCHRKVLSLQLAITEKEEASRVHEKLKRGQTEEKINNVISTISRIGQEIKVSGCNFVDNITKDTDEQSKSTLNAYGSNADSFLTELNIIKSLLHLGKENPDVEKESFSNNESESIDNESEMNFLQIILEE